MVTCTRTIYKILNVKLSQFWNYVICGHPTIQNLVLHRLIENPKLLCTEKNRSRTGMESTGFRGFNVGIPPPPPQKKKYILDRMSSVVEPEPDFFAGAGVGASG